MCSYVLSALFPGYLLASSPKADSVTEGTWEAVHSVSEALHLPRMFLVGALCKSTSSNTIGWRSWWDSFSAWLFHPTVLTVVSLKSQHFLWAHIQSCFWALWASFSWAAHLTSSVSDVSSHFNFRQIFFDAFYCNNSHALQCMVIDWSSHILLTYPLLLCAWPFRKKA